MNTSVTKLVLGLVLIVIAVFIGANGVYMGATDDAPGASIIGILLTIAGVALGVNTARNRLPVWAVRGAFVVGVLLAVFAGFLAYRIAEAVPLHPQPEGVLSVGGANPPPRWSAAVDQARPIVRKRLSEQNLPGLSVAVGIGGDIVWAEGFGWSDLKAQVPVTPDTRFRIGTMSTLLTSAAVGVLTEQGRLTLDDEIQRYVPQFPKTQSPVTLRQLMGDRAGISTGADGDDLLSRQRCQRSVDALPHLASNPPLVRPGWILMSAAVERAVDQPFVTFMREKVFQPLEMTGTGAESTTEENPEGIGEPGEDAPPITIIRRLFFEPLGIGRPAPRSAMDIATVYVPRDGADPRRGRLEMRLRNLSCYAGALAFFSTPSDLVRFGLAINSGTLLQPATVQQLHVLQDVGHDGELSGGTVASLVEVREPGIVVAVLSNISHTDTSAVARSVAEAFVTSGGR